MAGRLTGNFAQSRVPTTSESMNDMFKTFNKSRQDLIANEIAGEDRLLREKALLQQQSNADRTYAIQEANAARQAEEYVLKNKQREALIGLAADYRPYDESLGIDNSKMDAMVRSNIGNLTPSFMQGEQEIATGVTPNVDQDVYDAQAKMQAVYEQQRPSQESAYGSLLSQGIARGADPVATSTIAKDMTSGLTSDATNLTNAQAQAKEYNKRQEFNAKEANKFRVKGESGSGTVKSYKTIYDQITADNYGNMDADDIKNIVKTAEDKIPANRLAEMVSYFNKSGGLLTNGKFNFDKDEFKKALVSEMVNPKKADYNMGSPKEVEYATAGQFLQSDRKSKDDYNAQQLNDIFKVLGNSSNSSVSTLDNTPKTVNTNDAEVLKQEIKSPTTANTEGLAPKDMTWESFSNDKVSPTRITMDQVGEVQSLTGNNLINFDDANVTKNINGEDVYNLGGKYFVIGAEPTKEDLLVKEANARYRKESSDTAEKVAKITEYQRMVSDPDNEYTKDNFPGTKGEYDEYKAARADKNPSTLQKFWRDLTEPGYLANRVKKIEKEEGATAAANAILQDNGVTTALSAIGSIAGAIRYLIAKGMSKTAAEIAAKEYSKKVGSFYGKHGGSSIKDAGNIRSTGEASSFYKKFGG